MSAPGQLISTIAFSDLPTGSGAGGGGFMINPAGSVALYGHDRWLAAFDLQTGTLMWTWTYAPSCVFTGGSFSPDSTSLALIVGDPFVFNATQAPPPAQMRVSVVNMSVASAQPVPDPSSPPSAPPGELWHTVGLLSDPVFSPDGRLLAYRSNTDGLTMVNAATGKVMWSTPMAGTWRLGTFGQTRSLTFSPDSSTIGFISDDEQPHLFLYDTAHGDSHNINVPVTGPTWAWTPDSRWILTVSQPLGGWPTVTYTDADTGAAITSPSLDLLFTGAATGKNAVEFSRDATRVLIAGTTTVEVFDLPLDIPDPPQIAPTLSVPVVGGSALPTVAFSPGGRYVSMVDQPDTNGFRWRLLDTTDPTADPSTVPERQPGGGGQFTGDGRYIVVSADNAFEVLTVGDPCQPSTPDFVAQLRGDAGMAGAIRSAGITGGTAPLVVVAANPADGSSASAYAAMFTAANGLDLGAGPSPNEDPTSRQVGITGLIVSMACAPSDAWVAVGSADGLLQILHLNPDNDWFAPLLPAHHGSVNDIAVTPDSTLIATANSDGRARLFAVPPAPGQALNSVTPVWSTAARAAPTPSANLVAISPDGRYVAAGFSDGSVAVYENTTAATDHAPLHTITGTPGSRVNALRFGGPTVCAAGFDDSSAVLFDAATGQQTNTYLHNAPVKSVQFSADGTLLATISGPTAGAGSQLQLWAVGTGTQTTTPAVGPIDYSTGIWQISLSPTKPIVAAALDNATVAIYNRDTQANRLRLPFEQPTSLVAFSPAGDLMVAGSTNYLHLYSIT